MDFGVGFILALMLDFLINVTGVIVYQEKYWRELDQLKVHLYYLELYLESTIVTDRNINIFLAVASSGSIAGWVVFKDIPMLWTIIIAASQVIFAIRPYLPYVKRLKSLQGITNDLSCVFLSMEDSWFKVSEGKLADEEIHKAHMRFKEKIRQEVHKHFGAAPLPENAELLEKAKLQAKDYFANFYNK